MAIHVQCPKCQWKCAIEDDRYGGTVECEECGIRFLARRPGESEQVRIGMPSAKEGRYGSLAVFAGVVMILGVVQGAIVAIAVPIGLSVLMGALTMVMSILTGMLILAIRDIAIRPRETQEMVKSIVGMMHEHKQPKGSDV